MSWAPDAGSGATEGRRPTRGGRLDVKLSTTQDRQKVCSVRLPLTGASPTCWVSETSSRKSASALTDLVIFCPVDNPILRRIELVPSRCVQLM